MHLGSLESTQEAAHPAKNYYFGISTGYVIKQLVHAFSCTYIELWMHLGSLESTKKLELLSAAPRPTLTLLSCSPNFPRAFITRCTHAKHEPIVKFFAGCRSSISLPLKL